MDSPRDEVATGTYQRIKKIQKAQSDGSMINENAQWLCAELLRAREALIILGFRCDHCEKGAKCHPCENIIRFGLGEKQLVAP